MVAGTERPFIPSGEDIEAVVVLGLNLDASAKGQEVLVQFDSIAFRYRTQRGLLFVAASRDNSARVHAFSQAHARRAHESKLVVLANADGLLEAAMGSARSGTVALIGVDVARDASLSWRGHLMRLEGEINALFPFADSSEEEAE